MVYGEGGYERGKSAGFSPIKFVGTILGYIIGLALAIIIIITPLSMVFQNNILFSYYYNKVTDPLINTGFGNFVKKGLSALSVPFSEKKQAEVLESYSWKSSIDENSKKQSLGVEIKNFNARNDLLRNDFENVEATAEVQIYSTESTTIEFSCLTEDDKLGEVADNNEIISIPPNRKISSSVKCIYQKDLFDIEDNEATDSQKIRIRASYEFSTEAYMPIYTLQKNSLETSIEKGDNIFIENKIQDENLDENEGIASSVYTKAPVRLILRSISSQPYTEEGPFGQGSRYALDLRVDDVQEWTGSLKEIKGLSIYIPEEISINSEDFEYSGEEENFKIYSAKGSLINELNSICKSRDKKILDFIDEECWRRGAITTGIEFSVNNAQEELSKTFIRAKLDYIFNDEKQDTITFLNT